MGRNRIIFGRHLFNCNDTYRESREAMEDMTKDCLFVTHKLNKLHLMGHTDDSSHIVGLYLALATLNLSECTNIDGKDFE